MDSFREGQPPDELPDPGDALDEAAADRDMESELMPPEDAAISPELLDELFDEKDPRVQSGVHDVEQDEDLDFIRMSGLTSPDVPKSVDALTPKSKPPEMPEAVSFYEPGVADVDESMHHESFGDTDDPPEIEKPITSDTEPDSPTSEDDALADLLAESEPEATQNEAPAADSEDIDLDELYAETTPPEMDDAITEEPAESLVEESPVEASKPDQIIDDLAEIDGEVEPEQTEPDEATSEESAINDNSDDDPLAALEAELAKHEDESDATGFVEDDPEALADAILGAANESKADPIPSSQRITTDEIDSALAAIEGKLDDIESRIEPKPSEPPAPVEETESVDVVEQQIDAAPEIEMPEPTPPPTPEQAAAEPSDDIVPASLVDEADSATSLNSATVETREPSTSIDDALSKLEADGEEVNVPEPLFVEQNESLAEAVEPPLSDEATSFQLDAPELAPAEPLVSDKAEMKAPPVDLPPAETSDDEVFADLLTPNVDLEPVDVVNPKPVQQDRDAEANLSKIEAENKDLGDNTPLDDDGLDRVLIESETTKSTEPAQPPVFAASEGDDEPEPYEDPHTVQEVGHRRSRHRRRKQSAVQSVLKAAVVVLVFGGAIAYGGYEAYRWFEVQVSNPTTLFYEAEEAAANGRYLQASRLYEEFARRNTGHALTAEAMFGAGYAMQQVVAEDAELTHEYNQEALALLNDFVRDYPDHPRAGRAKSLMGFVHYRMGNFRAAVDAFIDRDAVMRDPVATLPMLRTLARSYAQLGDYEAAHSTYIRAANSPGNPSPDLDYDELGEMYRTLAQNTEAPEQHQAFEALALEQWTQAIRYPGINPTRKNAIRVKVDLLEELGGMEERTAAEAMNVSDTDVVVPVDVGTVRPASFEVTGPVTMVSREVTPVESPEPPAIQRGPKRSAEPAEIPEPAPVQTDAPGIHSIGPGDQLLRIANDHGLTMEELMTWNGIENADHIEVGQLLRLTPPPEDSE